METPPSPTSDAPAAEQPLVIDYKAKLLALLKLDESADEAAIDAKLGEIEGLIAKAGTAGEIEQRMLQVQQELEAKSRELDELHQAKREAEADELLAPFADLLGDDAARTAMRELALNNRPAAEALLNGLKRPAAEEKPGKGVPPPPMHDPSLEVQDEAKPPTEEEIAKAIRTRADALKSAQPKANFRDLWTQAESEIRERVAAGQPLSR